MLLIYNKKNTRYNFPDLKVTTPNVISIDYRYTILLIYNKKNTRYNFPGLKVTTLTVIFIGIR